MQTASFLPAEGNISFIDFLIFIAINRNLEIAEMYEAAAQKAKNNEIKEFFGRIAEIKIRDVKNFQEAQGETGAERPAGSSQRNGCSAGTPRTPNCRDPMYRRGLPGRLKIEMDNYEFYLRLAQVEENVTARSCSCLPPDAQVDHSLLQQAAAFDKRPGRTSCRFLLILVLQNPAAILRTEKNKKSP